MNLEVDVMEGDEFSVAPGGCVFQHRAHEKRAINCEVHEWCNDSKRYRLVDFSFFKRYCEGCGLTVKEVKSEPQVETIKPPEWGVLFSDGQLIWFASHEQAKRVRIDSYGKSHIVRIDWGAK